MANRVLSLVFSSVVGVSAVSGFATAAPVAPGDLPVEAVKKFDGQMIECDSAGEVGDLAYRLTSPIGTVTGDQLEVSVEIETFVCVKKQGMFSLESTAFNGKFVNAEGGFIDFERLDFLFYTPDLKVTREVSLDKTQSKFTVKVSAAITDFESLKNSAVSKAGERRVLLTGFLRGIATMGVAATGEVLDHGPLMFGDYNILLSETTGALK